jgi:23S rRNA pseudouridine1911/1915/1917 synthase
VSSPRKSQHLIYQVPADLVDQRIDKVLASIPEIATRSQAAKLMQMGAVRKNGRVLKPSYQTQAGDEYQIDVPIIETEHLLPYDFKLDIVFEDADLIVVNKPAGLVVHPACGHEQDTLVNALLHYTTDLSMGYNEKRPGLVHRIDKGTSGLLVIAKNDEAQRILAEQFKRKTVHRIYKAIAFGFFREKTGTIRSHLKRHPENRKRVASSLDGDGKLAITHYRVLQESVSGLSLLEMKLETGRTHQIRVHLSEAGHPIAGDTVYGADKRVKALKSIQLRGLIESMTRFALHAEQLGFTHPRSGERILFTAPWPEDLLPLVRQLGFE